MNFKGFKKVHEDESKAVLRNGAHSITIAKKVLSPQHLKGLKELPLYSYGGNDTEGADTSTDTQPGAAPTGSPIVINVGGQAPQAAPVQQTPVAPPPAAAAPMPAAQQAPAPDVQQPGEAAPAMGTMQGVDSGLAGAPEAPEAPAAESQNGEPGLGLPTNPAQAPQQMLPGDEYVQEVRNFGQDAAGGHIHPKTMSDMLWGSAEKPKTILGKLGTVFGLLMSGAGSGLTGQPNALLSIMDKQIQRDMEAQQQTVGNKLSFGKMLDEHLAHQANISKTNQDIYHLALQDSAVRNELELGMRRRYLFDQVYKTIASKYPPGSPEANNAMAALGMMSQGMEARDQSARALINSRWGLYQSQSDLLNGGQGPSGQEDGIDYKKFNRLKTQAQMKMPGAPTESELHDMTKEATDVLEARAIRKTYVDSFKNLNRMFLAGGNSKYFTNQRAAYVNALSAKLATLTSHRYNAGEAAAQAEGMFPAWSDLGGKSGPTRHVKFKKGLESIDALESGTPTLNRYGVKMPPAQAQLEEPQKEQGKAEPTKWYNGKQYKRGPNGEAVEVK